MNKICTARAISMKIGEELGKKYLEPTQELEQLTCKVYPFPMNHGKMGKLFWDDFAQASEALHSRVAQFDENIKELDGYKRFINECAEECKQNETNMLWIVYHGRKRQQ